jgi:hypothetical protein
MRDTWQESKTPVVVYATEAAINTSPMVPSDALMRFVKAENKAFRQELNLERVETRRTGPTEPMSPSKRKHRSDSTDSMDSNRASLGSNEDHSIEDPFGVPPESYATEMQDMSRDGGCSQGAQVQFTVGAAGTTRQAGPGDSAPNGTQQEAEQREDDSQTATPDTEAKAVEMQERARPITLVSASQEKVARGSSPSVMDMEIPDHEE